ncbi:hypothetical protein Tco_0498084, partial [Tanacetum coccineum]
MTAVNGGQRRSTPSDHRSTAAINDGQWWRTTAGPPLDHRRTTIGPPPDHRSTVVDRQSRQ